MTKKPKWSSGIPIFCLLAVMLSCESAYPKLKSLNDLKKIDFGRSVPKHSLLLLHWFANIIDIDIDNNDILLLTFDPDKEDFGSHHYGNYEDMLDPLPQGYRYYTVGNLHEDTSRSLPTYVLQPPVREYVGNNMDRIIFRVQERSSRPSRIDRVYLTQHYRQHEHQGTRYNPELTYHISTTLLHEMRLFSLDNSRIHWECRDPQDSQLWEVSDMWGKELICLGLLLCIVIQDKYSVNMRPQQVQSEQNDLKPEEGGDKLAQAPSVSNVSNISNDNNDNNGNNGNNGNNDSNLTGKNEWHQEEALTDKDYRNQRRDNCMLTGMNEGMTDSSNTQDGVQNREQDAIDTHVKRYTCIYLFMLIVMCAVFFIFLSFHKGEEACQQSHPSRVQIPNYDAHLEIMAKQHKACARLYVGQHFRLWRSEFEQSWVGFYESVEKDTSEYVWGQWQWVTKFMSCSDYDDNNGYCLEYCSRMKAATGVQARFILKHMREIAHTPGFQSPDGVEIAGYNAHLQFFVQNSKACARLYVSKSFWHWRSEFKKSWIGFYKSVNIGTLKYDEWQWATEVNQCPGSWWEYLIFEYCSGLQANPGVHVRFILKDTIEIARTPNWQHFN